MELAGELGRMIEARQSGSVIVIGAPGSGKTKIVRHATSRVRGIWLDGLISDDFSTNLVHLSKLFGVLETDSFEELAEALIQRHSKGILEYTVIIIEWLEMFVEGGQQLLYGLLELTTVVPVLLIGLTRRVDVVEGMEKRVRSRFSQSVLYLAGENPMQSIEDPKHDLSVPELLVLATINRLLQKQHTFLDTDSITSEYYTNIKQEISGIMLTTSQVHGDRQLTLAIESLVLKGILVYARNDVWVERGSRLLQLALPKFVLPGVVLESPACPIPIKHLVQQM